MSSHRKEERRGSKALNRLEADQDWQRLLSWLPPDLEAIAVQMGAFRRPRVVTNGAMLLRLVLLYAVGTYSLADVAAWAARALGIELTADALAYRFTHATAWIEQLVVLLLHHPVGPVSGQGTVLRVIDASVLTVPGSTGTDWRLHVTFDPVHSTILGLELTDSHGAEHLARACGRRGDVVIADRAYGHASDVRVARERQMHCLLRAHLQNLPVQQDQQRLAPAQLLDEADAGQVERNVKIPEHGYPPVAARLIVVPLSAENAARARQSLRKARKGRVPSALTLRLAGYFCCITTLSAQQVSVETVLRCYRLRWQVELLFKRCKSLLHLDHLPQARPALVKLLVWARLLIALVVERMAFATRQAIPFDSVGPPVSQWRLTQIHLQDVALAVYGSTSLDHRLAAARATAMCLRE